MLRHFPSLMITAYRNYIVGVFISGIGGEVVRIATAWYLYDLTKSKVLLGMLGLVGFASTLITSQIAGVIVDRVNRKLVLSASNALLALIVLMFGGLIFLKSTDTTIILMFYGVATLVLAFEGVARGSIYPNLVPKELLANAITIHSVVFNLRKIIGPTVAGFLIVALPLEGVYGFSAITFIVLSYIALTMPHLKIQVTKDSSYTNSYAQGIRFILGQKLILATGIMDFLIMFFASAQTILPALVQDIYKGGPIELGILYSAISIGALVPGIYFSTKHRIPNMRNTLVVSVVVVALATIVFGLTSSLFVGFVALVLFGIGDEISSIIRNNIRQTLTPDHMRARMVAIMSLFYVGGPRLGDFEAGITAAWWGLQPSLVVNGIFALITAGAFHIIFHKNKKEFKRMESES